MPTEDRTPSRPPPRSASRWSAATSPFRPYRLTFRLLGIPILAVAAVYLYSGVRDRIVLPECDSARARRTLSEVFDQLKMTPLRFEPLTTVSSTKDEVVCSAVLPLPDGANVVADYKFYWDGGTAQMKYSVVRKAPGNT
jgi:hypothetical protein